MPRVVPGAGFARDTGGAITLDPLDPAGFRQALAGVRARGIVWLWALDPTAGDDAGALARRGPAAPCICSRR